MCFDNDDVAEFYEETVVKSRKPHRCEACNRVIPVGELALSFSGKHDGTFFSGHTCGECEATRFRIHRHELHEKCTWRESWCPLEELVNYCRDTGFRRSTHFVGQLYLTAQRNRAKREADTRKKTRK